MKCDQSTLVNRIWFPLAASDGVQPYLIMSHCADTANKFARKASVGEVAAMHS